MYVIKLENFYIRSTGGPTSDLQWAKIHDTRSDADACVQKFVKEDQGATDISDFEIIPVEIKELKHG